MGNKMMAQRLGKQISRKWEEVNGEGRLICLPIEGTENYSLSIVQCGEMVLSSLKDFSTLLFAVTSITIAETKISDEWVKLLELCPNAENLSMRSVDPAETVVKVLTLFHKLSTLQIHNVAISKLPDDMVKIWKLTKLDISSSRIVHLPKDLMYELESLNVQESTLEVLPSLDKELTKLTRLNISNTAIKEIPSSYFSKKLEELFIGQRLINQLPTEILSLTNLRRLSLSGTAVAELPTTPPAFLDTLTLLDISYTSIKKLPKWLAQAKNLRTVGLAELALNSFPKEIMLLFIRTLEIPFLDEVPRFAWEAEDEGDSAGVYIAHMFLSDMDVRLLLTNDAAFLPYYYNMNKVITHEVQVVFCGKTSGENRSLILDVLEIENDDVDVQNVVGFEKIDHTMLLDNQGRRLLNADAKPTFWILKDDDAYQAVHSIFLGENCLYVVLLDADKRETLMNAALKWSRYIEMHSPWAQVLYVLMNMRNETEGGFLQQFKVIHSINIPIHSIVVEDYAAGDLGASTVLAVRKKLAGAIKAMPGYNWETPQTWIQMKTYLNGVFDVSGVVTPSQYDAIQQNIFQQDRSVRIQTRQWLAANTPFILAKKDTENTSLLAPLRIAPPLYYIMTYARHMNGLVTSDGFFEWLMDQDVELPFSLTRQEIAYAFALLADRGICFAISEKSYCFPSENRSPVSCTYWDEGKQKKGTAMDWIEPEKLKFNDNRHYIIHFDYLPRDVLTAILAEIWHNCKDIWLQDESLISEKGVGFEQSCFVTTEGAVFAFPLTENSRGGTLYISGQTGVASEIHIISSPFQPFNSPDNFLSAFPVESKFLKKYATIALKAVTQVYEKLKGYRIHLHYTPYICLHRSGQEVRISLQEIEAYIKASKKEMYLGLVNSTENLAELRRKYLPEE